MRNDPVIDFTSERPKYPSLQAWLDDLWISGTAIAHPDYSAYSQFPNTYDVGVVVLDESIQLAEYGELPRSASSTPSVRPKERHPGDRP